MFSIGGTCPIGGREVSIITEIGNLSADDLKSTDTATYNNWSGLYELDDDTACSATYPANMYSTSKIRVDTLNAGGKYSQDSTTLAEAHEQDRNNQYARFTMGDADNSVTEYLATPSEVGYQADEWDEATSYVFESYSYYYPNDAYETPITGGRWYSDDFNYGATGRDDVREDGAKYGSWKDDYVWLPSAMESGVQDSTGNGIWETDASLRSLDPEQGLTESWLRTGSAYYSDLVYAHSVSGGISSIYVNYEAGRDYAYGVRPAIHLNLTSAAENRAVSSDDWQGGEKTYDPSGVTWQLVNTEDVTITPVDGLGGTIWYNGETHTVSAVEAGDFQIKVQPTELEWDTGGKEERTVTYTIAPADMTLKFNGEKFPKRRDVVFSSDMSPIELKLPETTDSTFPISWKGVTWDATTASKLEIRYIVKTHDEAEHSDDVINNYLNELKEGKYEEEWKSYEALGEEGLAKEPMGYVVYFKATDTEGNHKPLYDYFGVHIAQETLNITLTQEAREGFTNGVEYGDAIHDKESFETAIIDGIDTITANGDPTNIKTQFSDNRDNFTFYLRKDNTVEDDTVLDDGDIYTIEEDGVHLHKAGSTKVELLPLGTYHLYVAYTAQPEGEEGSKYITFTWVNGRPSFTVSPRKVKVTLTFTERVYGDDPTGWVTATAARNGKDDDWYAGSDAENVGDLHTLNLSYTLQGTGGAPSRATPAGTYTVVPSSSNENYEVEFVGADGGSTLEYTVNKREITEALTWNREAADRVYDGNAHSCSATVNANGRMLTLEVTVEGENGNETFRNVDNYTFTAALSAADDRNYKFANSVVLTKSAKITPATLNVEWGEKTYAYSGEVIGESDYPAATVSGLKSDDDEVSAKVAPNTDLQFAYALNVGLPSATTNAGTYNVIATYQEGNYEVTFVNAAGGDLTYTIGKAPLTVTAKDHGIIYGDLPSDGGVDYVGFVNGEHADVLTGSLSYTFDYVQYGDVGDSYTILPYGLSSDNYEIYYMEGTLTVSPKEIEVTWGDASYTYTGSAFAELPTATAEGIGTDGTFTLVVSPDFEGDFLNAGEYRFKAALDGAGKSKNYVLKTDTMTHFYTVEKQTVVAPAIASKVYNGTTQTADVADSPLYTVTENDGGIEVDEYDVKLTLSHPENYKWEGSEEADLVVTFSITKADYDMSGVTFEDGNFDYDAKEHSLAIGGTLPDGVTMTYDGNGMVEVGDHTVTAIFTGDARNYNAIPSMTATLTITAISHDLSGIRFDDVTVKYDGATHSIYIEGELPHGVSVVYENNEQVDPNIYTVTAVFSDLVSEFDRMTATLTILRLHAETEHAEGSRADVILDCEDGFDPTLVLTVEKFDTVSRSYWAWEDDVGSRSFAVRMCKDGAQVPFEGKFTVRILIPEEFRDKDFELFEVSDSAEVHYTRDGDYVIFEADELSTYVFRGNFTSYLPYVFVAAGILLVDVLAMGGLSAIIKKKNKKVR